MIPTLFNPEDTNLTFIDPEHTEVFTDSLIIANKLDMKHYKLKDKIRKLITKGILVHPQKGCTKIETYKDKQNKDQEKYLFDQEQTMRLIMELQGKKAHEIKNQFVKAFFSQQHELSYWRQTRSQSKQLNKEVGSTIQKFVEYAKANGSKNYDRYYNMFQKQINQCIVGQDSFKRDTLPKIYLELINELQSYADVTLEVLLKIDEEYHSIAKKTLAAIRSQADLIMQDTPKYAETLPTQKSLF